MKIHDVICQFAWISIYLTKYKDFQCYSAAFQHRIDVRRPPLLEFQFVDAVAYVE